MPARLKLLTNIMLAASALLALIFWACTIQQPLIDQHEFRQTQTALSALFMGAGVHSLVNYETPVLGNPWAIPFEFPFFQWTVSLAAKLLPLSLSSCGRLVSLLFGLGCLWPSLGMMRQFDIPRSGQKLFLILVFTSSIYLYWNRSFMIESTALFFTLVSLYTYVSIRKSSAEPSRTSAQVGVLVALFLITLSLGLLIKATTALPALLLLALDCLCQFIQTFRSIDKRQSERLLFILLAGCMMIAFLLMHSWTQHADSLKQINPIGKTMTSQALSGWNFGTPQQRFSGELWKGVVMDRMLTPLGAIPGLLLLGWGFALTSSNKTRRLFLSAAIWLALGPLLIFSNIHIVHNYYQAANQIYLLMAIAAATSILIEKSQRRTISMIAIGLSGLIVAGNLVEFWQGSHYFSDAQIKNSVKLEIGQLIQTRTDPEAAILVLDDDWSSAFAYHSRRRSLAAPQWYRETAQRQMIDAGDASWLGGRRLGAVISEPSAPEIQGNGLNKICPAPEMHSFSGWQVSLCDPVSP